jgi:macrolide-specific efflux system membrane fusion protein
MSFLKKNFKKIIIIIVVIIIGFIGYHLYSTNKINSNVFNPKTEIIVNPKRQNIIDQLTAAGSIDATNKANLQFQTSGQLAWVGVKVGDKVKKYQAIASLNKEQLQKQLAIDFNNYRSTLSTFDDTQDTYKTEKDNLTLTDDMKRILVRTQNTLDNSVINYELGDLAIKYATLVTPISGIVTSIDQPSSGINVNPSNANFSIIDPNSIYFSAQIDESDIPKLKVGDKTTINLDSFPNDNFDSTVTYIAFTPVVGQSSTVYEVHFSLPQNNDNLKYRLGMSGNATIDLSESQNALTLPIEAVQQDNGINYVNIKDSNNQLIKKNIKTGIETDTTIEILEGLSENDQIVINK